MKGRGSVMHKNILCIRQLGENDFWHILHDVAHYSEDAFMRWQQCVTAYPVHFWQGSPDTEESAVFKNTLASLEISLIEHNCTAMDAELLEQEAQKYIDDAAIHITCGFDEGALDVLTSVKGKGLWLNGCTATASPWAAMAEVALWQECGVDLSLWRVCWLGKVNGLGHSLMETAIYAPFEFFMGIPPWGDPEYYSTDIALKSGAKIFLTREPHLALDGAQCIYMDVQLAQLAQEAKDNVDNKKAKMSIPMTPLHLTDTFQWQQGFVLTPKYAEYAQPTARVVSTLAGAVLPQTDADFEARRIALQRIVLMRVLEGMSKIL